jgi:hypothetical protein
MLDLLVWIIIPVINFFLWFKIGCLHHNKANINLDLIPCPIVLDERDSVFDKDVFSPHDHFKFTEMKSSDFQRHKGSIKISLSCFA